MAGAYGATDDAGAGWDVARLVGQALEDREETLAVAESCTGGLVASMVTDVAGASAYLRLGVVAYVAPTKERVLGVPAELIAEHGAVSAPVAAAMATGVRDLADATWGLATTGVAGPTGGTEETPVGTLWTSVAGAGAPPGGGGGTGHTDAPHTARHRLPGDRLEAKARMAARALQDLLDALGPAGEA